MGSLLETGTCEGARDLRSSALRAPDAPSSPSLQPRANGPNTARAVGEALEGIQARPDRDPKTGRFLPADPPSKIESQLMGMGDSIMISKLFMLWLQAFDNQPGVSVPFKNLDYQRVINWLERILTLDPKGQYPLLAAGRIYGVVEDDEKKAANSSRLEIIVPSIVRGAVWMKNTFPYFINPILGKSFKKQLDSTKQD